jgi:signal transduction histidine kinase
VSVKNLDLVSKGRSAIHKSDSKPLHPPKDNNIDSIAHDISILDRLLHSAEHKLDTLSRRSVMLLEEERRACGAELHDQIGQDLTLLNMALAQASRRKTDSVDWSAMQKMVSGILFKVRHFSHALVGVNFDEVDLNGALEELVRNARESSGLNIELRVEISRELPEEIGITFYRLAQEAITNVLRYARADRVKIEIWEAKQKNNIQIVDNGVGFDMGPDRLDGARPEATHQPSGLNIMRRRVEMLGGKLEISSSTGGGTMLLAAIPQKLIQATVKRGRSGND